MQTADERTRAGEAAGRVGGDAPDTSDAPDPDGSRKGFVLALGAIALVAFGVRVWWVLEGYSHYAVGGDASYYHLQAWALADGKGFINPFDWYQHGVVTPACREPAALQPLPRCGRHGSASGRSPATASRRASSVPVES